MPDKWYMDKRGGIALALSYQIRWWCEDGLPRLVWPWGFKGGKTHWDVLIGVDGRLEYEKNLSLEAKDILLLRLRSRRFKTYEYSWSKLWKEMQDEQDNEMVVAWGRLLTIGLPDRSSSTSSHAGNR